MADSATDLLSPTNSTLQVTNGTTASPTNVVGVDPNVVNSYDLGLSFAVWRGNVNFVGAVLVVADLPTGGSLGDYHLSISSPAPPVNGGAASKATVAAPAFDIDRQLRPLGTGIDMGADEAR